MNPFLEIPITEPDHSGNPVTTTARIKPGEIEFYIDRGEAGCGVVMSSGSTFSTPLTFDVMDQYLFTFYGHIKKEPGKFGNIVVTVSKKDAVKLKPVPKTETPSVAMDV
jgi:hypothetical protein